MQLSDINPFIRYANEVSIRPTEAVFYSYDCRLIYLLEGELTMHCGNHQHDMSAGSIAIWQGGTPYTFQFEKSLHILVFDFDLTQHFTHLGESLHTVTAENYIPEKTIPKRTFEEFPDLEGLLVADSMQSYESDLRLTISELQNGKRLCRELASTRLRAVILQTIRASLNDSQSTDMMEHIIAYIRDNYRKPINNSDIARAVHYHVTSLNALVAKQTGTTLHQYLLEYRLNRAADLLVSTDLQISELSDQCGFRNCSYFCRVFKEHFGETPLKYRHGHKGLV